MSLRQELERLAKIRIEPEHDDGNKEYKLRLDDDRNERLEQIATQMRYRLEEGNGEAFYTLGVTDSGGIIGLSDEEYRKSRNILEQVCEKNNYSLTLLSRHCVNEEKTMYEFLIREKNQNRYIDIRVACAGNVDVGKCLAAGTQIRLHDAQHTLKKIEDIQLGDRLLGDDGNARTVLKTSQGIGQMYKITRTYGSPLIVNKNHILCFMTNDETRRVTELTLEQFVSLSEYARSSLRLYKILPAGDITLCDIINITIEPYQAYYGFELDGNGRFLLEDYTVTHNSSLLGVLLTGKRDNGRGEARLNVFNYPHEVKSGRTSSIAHHILGFDRLGNAVYNLDGLGYRRTWPEIIRESAKVITFFDLCGHERYLKTTIAGLTSQSPDLALVLVGGNMGITKMTKEHIFLCLSLHIPFAIVVTKLDICKDRQDVLSQTVKEVKQLISAPGVRRIPYDVKTDEDLILCAKNIHSLSTVPFFYVSNVTEEGIPSLRQFLNLYTKRPKTEKSEHNVELHVDQAFQVSGVGTVIGGQLIQGRIKTGDKLLLGPTNGTYSTVQVRSIHCKRVSVDEVESGCYVCLAVKKPETVSIRRGQVLLSVVDRPVIVYEFIAEIVVLRSHATTIKVGYEPVVHGGAIRQTARILSITNKQCNRQTEEEGDDVVLRTGDRANVRFRFCYRPEFIRVGFRILMAEGRVKLIGKVTGVVDSLGKVD